MVTKIEKLYWDTYKGSDGLMKSGCKILGNVEAKVKKILCQNTQEVKYE